MLIHFSLGERLKLKYKSIDLVFYYKVDVLFLKCLFLFFYREKALKDFFKAVELF